MEFGPVGSEKSFSTSSTGEDQRGRLYLCSLLIDLRPVGLERDHSVELVQSQVGVLYVLIWRHEDRQVHFVVSKDINNCVLLLPHTPG